MHHRGVRLAAGLLALGSLLGSCSPASLVHPPVDPAGPGVSFEPSSSEATPADLGHGTATITITSGEPRVVALPDLSDDEPSVVLPGLGAVVSWRGGDWGLEIQGGGSGGFGSDAATLTIIRDDTDPPLQADGTPCTVTFTELTPTHVAGRAVCKNLAWVDRMGGPMDLPIPSGSPTVDHQLFDATIVFDATP